MKKKRILAVLSALIIITFLTSTSQAATQETSSKVQALTLDEVLSRAIANSHKGEELEQTIKSLWDQHYKLQNDANAAKQMLDSIEEYQKLYDEVNSGKRLSVEKYQTYRMYAMMFGTKRPELTPQDKYTNFVSRIDVNHYSVWAVIQNLKVDKEFINASIASGMRMAYDQILGLYEALEIQQELYGTREKQHQQLLEKYKAGQVSELDKYLSDIELQQLKMEIDKLKRSLENAEMGLKQQIGVPLKQKITLKPYNSQNTVKAVLSYDEYLDKALKNRWEVVKAKTDFEAKQREFDIKKQYFIDEMAMERIEARQAVDDKADALRKATDDVIDDITSGYIDLDSKGKDVTIAFQQKENAEKQYKNAKIQYESGMITLNTLWSIEDGLTQRKIGYKQAVRGYNYSLFKMDMASGIGPGYGYTNEEAQEELTEYNGEIASVVGSGYNK